MSEPKPKRVAPVQSGRRIWLINPEFQLSFLGCTLGVSLLLIGFFYAADAYFFWKFHQLGESLGLPSDHVFFQFLEEQKQSKSFYYGVAAGTSVVFLAIWGLLLSHRVAGPLYRLRKHLTSVALGETTSDVRFRTGDYFQEVAEAYNLQMKRYRSALGVPEAEQSDGQSSRYDRAA